MHVPARPSASLLRARSTTSFDDQGRAYRTKVFSVDPGTGAISANGLTTNLWYDRRGFVTNESQPGGLVHKAKSDGAGRAVKWYATDGGGDTGWADAGTAGVGDDPAPPRPPQEADQHRSPTPFLLRRSCGRR